MLTTLRALQWPSLNRVAKVIDEVSDETIDKATPRWKQIEKFLETHELIMNADVRKLHEVSAPTANQILSNLVAEGTLAKCRKCGRWSSMRI